MLLAKIFLCTLCLFTTTINISLAQLQVIHSWKFADYAFPSHAAKAAMIRKNLFIPKNIAILDVDIWRGHGGKQKTFVTMPRFKPGVPATLATVGDNSLLYPYPEWSWHREGDCDGITSVFRIQVDDCGRLWVLDTGKINNFSEDPKQICKPQLLLFNPQTDTLIGRYRFPDSLVDPESVFITIAVDTRGHKCQDTFAYVADVAGFKMVVFDANTQKSWRISSNYFYPYPLHGSFNVNGVKFDLMDGLFGLALGPIIRGDRTLYFHSLASVRESWVKTSVIRNSSLFMDGNGSPESFMVSKGERPSQSAAEAMTGSGVLFFGLMSNNSIACWNSRLPYSKENIITVAKDDTNLQFASGLKIKQGDIYILSSRLQNYIAGSVPFDKANYRVVKGHVDQLTKNTLCSGYNPSPILWPAYNHPLIYQQGFPSSSASYYSQG